MSEYVCSLIIYLSLTRRIKYTK